MTGATVVILLIAAIIVVFYYKRNMAAVQVYRFHKPSCPACVTSHDEWVRLKNASLFKPIKFVDVDISVKNNRALADSMGVRRVPHVVAVNDLGESYVYSGKRLAVDYLNWIMSLPR